MTRSAIETILGAVVLLLAGWFLVFSYKAGHTGSSGGGYLVYADFAGIGGLKPGDAVEISGVKVGTVANVELIPETYLARVKMNLQSGLKLPEDTAAMISSESLLGGRYLSLSPGADEKMIAQGGRIQYTQAPQNLEELLGKFIFSMQGEKKDAGKDAKSADASAPADASPAQAEAPVEKSMEKTSEKAPEKTPDALAPEALPASAPPAPEPASGAPAQAAEPQHP